MVPTVRLEERGFARELIGRARDSGYSALVLTVDAPVAGGRLRDVRNGLTIPPKLSIGTVLEGANHPAWWWDLMTTEAELIDRVFDPAVDFHDLAWLKGNWQARS